MKKWNFWSKLKKILKKRLIWVLAIYYIFFLLFVGFLITSCVISVYFVPAGVCSGVSFVLLLVYIWMIWSGKFDKEME